MSFPWWPVEQAQVAELLPGSRGRLFDFGFPAFWGLIRDGAAPSRLIDSWGSWKLGSLIQPLGFGKLEEQMEPFDLAYLHTSVLPDDSRNISVMLVDTHLDKNQSRQSQATETVRLWLVAQLFAHVNGLFILIFDSHLRSLSRAS